MYPHHLQVVRELVARDGEVELVHTACDVITDDGRVVAPVAPAPPEPINVALLHNNFWRATRYSCGATSP